MPLLLNLTYPYFRIFIPARGEYRTFTAGRLELEKDDPDYELIMAEAIRNSTISIHEHIVTCVHCDEPFTGKAAKAQLGKHVKDIHFDKWLANADAEHAEERDKQLKARAGFACDVCAPVQEFGTPADLAEHVRELHANAPKLDAQGNEIGGRADDEADSPAASARTAEIPAAT